MSAPPAHHNGTNPIEIIFFDVRDTLGEVDRPGHLVPYKPSTEKLLDAMRSVVGVRVGVITNLPEGVTAEVGRKMLDDAGITPYLDKDGLVINHEAGASKPAARIYQFAARKAGVEIGRCMYVSENLIEVIGAEVAGMQTMLKPCPPGREFLTAPLTAGPGSPTFSGRVFELLFEEEHLLGKRIVGCAVRIVQAIEAGQSPPPLASMGLLVYLTKYFVDPFHHRKEEEILFPLAVARGLKAEKVALTVAEHDQGRAYFRGMETALARLNAGDGGGALSDFRACAAGFVELYKGHGKYEDDVLFPEIGRLLTDSDDSLLINLVRQRGPADMTPYLGLIQDMERELKITPA